MMMMMEYHAFTPGSLQKLTPCFPRWYCTGSSTASALPEEPEAGAGSQMDASRDTSKFSQLVLNRRQLVQSRKAQAALAEQVRTEFGAGRRRDRKPAVPIFRKS